MPRIPKFFSSSFALKYPVKERFRCTPPNNSSLTSGLFSTLNGHITRENKKRDPEKVSSLFFSNIYKMAPSTCTINSMTVIPGSIPSESSPPTITVSATNKVSGSTPHTIGLFLFQVSLSTTSSSSYSTPREKSASGVYHRARSPATVSIN